MGQSDAPDLGYSMETYAADLAALLDLLGRRWVLRIMWELREGSLTSRALRTA